MGYLEIPCFVHVVQGFSYAFVVWSLRKTSCVLQVVIIPASFSDPAFAPSPSFFAREADDSANDALTEVRVDVGYAAVRGGQFA